MFIIGIGKVVVGAIAHSSVSTVVTNVVLATMPKAVSKSGKIILTFGAVIVSNHILENSYFGGMMEDGVNDIIDSVKGKFEARQESKRQKQES